MKGTLTEKIMKAHLLGGELRTGETIELKIDQTLTQDSTGTMAYLELEALEVDHIKTDLSVAYVDHNILQTGFENADDHRFIRSCAEKYGIVYSKPGGGICHQLHLERFGRPGISLLGSDSHTPTDGGMGALAIGAGGLDVAVAMAEGFYRMKVPEVWNVYLTGSLRPGVNAKDLILELLRRLTVAGGLGKIFEYSGPGVSSLSLTDRATICNMGAELGATTSIFPSDRRTLEFLRQQSREEDYRPLAADPDAVYSGKIDIDLSALVPLVAQPDSPDKVVEASQLSSVKVDQVCIGSCTNSSYADLMKAAAILKGHKVAPWLDLTLSPGSSNILRLLSENGALEIFIEAGARLLESACGPCIGMGQSPASHALSLRTFNRNFKGRSGTASAGIFLASPETAAATAINGYITDPRSLGLEFKVEEPASYGRSDGYFIFPERPSQPKKGVEVVMGPNIKPYPSKGPLDDRLEGKILFRAGDNVTTDDICPSTAALLPYRSNIPYLSNYCLKTLLADFPDRARRAGGGFIVGGENYGQGSSREHAALLPLFLGVRVVFARSFARIHRSNLINSGILPLLFEREEDYERFEEGKEVLFTDLIHHIQEDRRIPLKLDGQPLYVRADFSELERAILIQGGYLNYVKSIRREG